MKSAVSSSSSGSEKVTGSGVTLNADYDLEENKPKSNSRMSCASDDSCAINELLEGRMDLNVTLPNNANSVVINVERRTPMLDLLVNISTQYRFNAANYTINAGDHEFKASTPIGTLDVNQIAIIPKPLKSGSVKSNSPSVIPFQTTFRLQVNLPRNQLMVLRVTPNATIAAIKQIICSEKALDPNKYQLVRFAGNNEGPHILDINKTLAYYTLNEVTLVSNKTLTQIELQYGTPSASQVDLSTSTSVSENKKAMSPLIISQSNPDITTIDDKTVTNHVITSKQLKKRPAPPPPRPLSSTLPNKLLSTQMNSHKEENIVSNLKKSDSMNKSDERVSQTIIEANPVLKVSANVVNHVRQNSGSDSSGYHESVLSSDSPESSSATLPKSSSTTATNVNNKQISNNKSGTAAKKRRAPPPPPSTVQQMNGINGNKNNDNTIDESKGVIECMSDVSLPLSTSSSSSGTASSINNRSLSPIVITQTNGSSTPLQISMNSKQTSLESESVQHSNTSETIKLNENIEEYKPNQNHEICVDTDIDRDDKPSEPLLITSSDSRPLNAINDEVDEEVSHDSLKEITISKTDIKDLQQEVDSKVEVIVENEESIAPNDDCIQNQLNQSCEPMTAITSKSTETLQKEVEVNCIAPALVADHENGRYGHEYVEQVVERDKSNVDHNEKTGSLNMPIKSAQFQFVYNRAIGPTSAQNSLHVVNVNNSSNSCGGSHVSKHRSYLDDIRRAYLHNLRGGGGIKLLLTGVNHNISDDNSDNQSNECAIDPTLINSELDLSELSVPLPPPSPFQNSNHEECSSSVNEYQDEGQGIQHFIESTTDREDTMKENFNEKHISNEQMIDNLQTKDQSIEETIETTQTSDNNITEIESQVITTTTTTPLTVCDEDIINKEIEVTLQSLNDELDRLESNDESDIDLEETQVVNDLDSDFPINKVNDNENSVIENHTKVESNNTSKVSVEVKQTIGNTSDIETIKSKFESRQSPAPSPTPRVISPINKSVMDKKDDTKTQFPMSTNGKTTVIVNKSQSPTPRSPSPQLTSSSPTNEDKLSITDEVRHVCRPRVRLTNFSIGSYKKDVDIFEDTPKIKRTDGAATAPVNQLATKSFVSFPSVKKEEKVKPYVNQTINKSKVNITATSTTTTSTSIPKPSIPVIQTLITSAPKINRIHSWSGQKSECLEEKNIKQPIKSNERYVSQISINKESNQRNSSPKTDKQSEEDLRSPQLVVQTLIAKTEEKIKNRSPSPKELPQKVEPIKEHTTISIKPGLETIIRSNSKQNNSEIINNEINSKQKVSQNISQQSIPKWRSNQTNSNKNIGEESLQTTNQPSVPPPIPPPIPPPVPQNIPAFPPNNSNSSVNKMNAKIFHTKGWNSNKVRSGEVPKVKHVEPPNTSADVRDQLLNEIKNFGGKNTLKKVSKNTSWKLEVNSVKT